MQGRNRPEITMILAVSVDGRLVSGDSDELDPNRHWKNTNFVRSIIYQFFDFSPAKDIYNFTTAASMVRVGVAAHNFKPKKSPLKLVVLDSEGELSNRAIKNLADSVEQLILVRKKVKGPDLKLPSNCVLFSYVGQLNLKKIAMGLGKKCAIKHLTVQSSGVMNQAWIESGILDHLTVIIYPLLVGDNGTPCVITPQSFGVKSLNLVGTATFDRNYISLQYDLRNEVPKKSGYN